jgi:hypothetical protein
VAWGANPPKGHIHYIVKLVSGPGSGRSSRTIWKVPRTRFTQRSSSASRALPCPVLQNIINHILALIVGPIDFHFLPPPCFWVFIFIISPFQSEVNNYFQLEKNN